MKIKTIDPYRMIDVEMQLCSLLLMKETTSFERWEENCRIVLEMVGS